MTTSHSHAYAVIGNPIDHSLSPQIHAHFANALGETIDYQKRLIDNKDERQTTADILALGQQGFHGLNVTVPFKAIAAKLADTLSDEARTAAAVNTLLFTHNKVYGHNSDGIGLMHALSHHGFRVTDKTILILGAGGATRGILHPLIQAKPSKIIIANRTAQKASDLADEFASYGCEIVGCGIDELIYLPDIAINGIIHATSMGLSGESPNLPAMIIQQAYWIYDLSYTAQGNTAFLDYCAQLGQTRLQDGWGMLVAQAAESYRYWRGVLPPTKALIDDRALVIEKTKHDTPPSN